MVKRGTLSKRIPRDLRNDAPRYGALFLLIAFGMAVIVGLAAAADSILYTVENNNRAHHVEDGEFSTFVPLERQELQTLSDLGITVEESFFLDIESEDNFTLRIFRNREAINQIFVETGRMADAPGEIVLEKQFARTHGYANNDSFFLGGREFTVTGIGCVPDYNYAKKTVSAMSSNSVLFGIGFVAPETYDGLRDNSVSQVDEEYSYSFLLNNAMGASSLKEYLSDLEVDQNQVNNRYLQELIDRANKEKDKFIAGVDDLVRGGEELKDAADSFAEGTLEFKEGTGEAADGADDIRDGMKELRGGLKELVNSSDALKDGAEALFDAMVQDVQKRLQTSGLPVNLTVKNYEDVLEKLLNSGKLPQKMKEDLTGMLTQLNQFRSYYEGIQDYARANQTAYDNAGTLALSAQDIRNATDTLSQSIRDLGSRSPALTAGSDKTFETLLAAANRELNPLGLPTLTRDHYAQILASSSVSGASAWLGALDNYSTFDAALNDYTQGLGRIKTASDAFSGGTQDLAEGCTAIRDGLGQLRDGTGSLLTGASTTFDLLIGVSNSNLEGAGLPGNLTRNNYEKELSGMISSGVRQAAEAPVKDALRQLKEYQKFYDALSTYTGGVEQAYEGAGKLADAMDKLANGLDKLDEGSSELYDKSAEMQDGADTMLSGLKELQEKTVSFTDEFGGFRFQNLASFTLADANPRIQDYREDALINRNASILLGVLLSLLVAFMMAIFTRDKIDRESSAIGTLMALGYRKTELRRHFLALPVLVAAAGGCVGTIAGFFLIIPLSSQSLSLYSFPPLTYVFSPGTIAYGVLLPAAFSLFVNYAAISKKLSFSPLALLRKEQPDRAMRHIDLKNMSFAARFRLRHTLREMRSHLTLCAGIFLAVLLIMLSFTIYGSIQNMKDHITDDVRYEWQYLLKFPPEEIPTGGEPCLIRQLHTYFPLADIDIEVTMQGMREDNPYFHISYPDALNEIVISDSAQQKFGWKTGDKIVLTDEVENRDYAFTVTDITPYAAGLSVFLNIENMRQIFGENETYYNALLASDRLSIDAGRVLSISTRTDIQAVADLFMDMLTGLIVILLSSSILLFVLVMFLMTKMIIDKNSISISLMKIFGYSGSEVEKLYLRNNFYTFVLAVLLSVPIGKWAVDQMYPALVSNVALGFDLSLPPHLYLIIFGIMFLSYFAVNFFLRRRLHRISPTLILKERE